MSRVWTLGLALVTASVLCKPALAQPSGGYATPAPFMELFFDFTGSGEPDYPAGRPTLGQMLTQAEIARLGPTASGGPLVLVVGSDIYVYDSATGARLGHERFRADRASGFYEMTAISHIGPAIAYLAQIKADGDSRWKERLASLQTHVSNVRALNLQAEDNWLDRLDQPAWRARKAEIRNMIDYACASTLAYLGSLGDGSRFTVAGVNDDFFNATSTAWPIPFRNIMIATFMLEALRVASDVQLRLAQLKLDWPAMVLVSSRAGTNVSSGLTDGTNWLVAFLRAASGFTLPNERIKIVPYAELRPSLGQPELAAADLHYYVQQVWGPLFYRQLVSDRVFSNIPTIYLPDRPALPGDPGVTSAAAIDQFMIRLKHSLRDAREMLSNTVAFWMVQELADKGWDPTKVAVPGLTAGLPPSVAGYPAVNLR
jgi:Domain of unknown function (DUF5624)